jgi:endonuclease/exonuclease/phosphatase family metal-dependent hydrolase
MAIKIISLNLWWGGHLFPEIVEFLKTENPDIVALQEVYSSKDSSLADKYRSMERLKAALGYPHSDFAEAYKESLPTGKVPHGNAVLSKFQINGRSFSYLAEPTTDNIEYKDIPEHWPIQPAPLQHVELDTSDGKVNLFNMHGVWDLDGDSYNPRRQHMVQVIITETSHKPNVIVTGDSNAKRTNQAMRELEAHLQPVFGDELVTTFNMKRKNNPGYATAAVDLMYVSPSIKVLSQACPPVDISDHLPLVVTFELQ